MFAGLPAMQHLQQQQQPQQQQQQQQPIGRPSLLTDAAFPSLGQPYPAQQQQQQQHQLAASLLEGMLRAAASNQAVSPPLPHAEHQQQLPGLEPAAQQQSQKDSRQPRVVVVGPRKPGAGTQHVVKPLTGRENRCLPAQPRLLPALLACLGLTQLP
jgi:hypothetical protein